ncbi:MULTISPECIES: response regulator transcription factor [Elizabethkingia]|uniref:LuxR family transcriptional regulator n=1 Tax=Elizabethkingia meningoseptica TaxID=238 RepID=A0A1V3TYT0_ELIME|nr:MULTISPECIES: response regulator transcription factor [Elizabethkingia]AQX13102.1 LuxR family transcriptional regulator [Elizabethkingia meningoseptica]MBG0514716.1 response regulator transcription factor [Elizabethkingia meningoseptica]MDE5431161.1 response regulator transcription factor [Elizabethkingia meningoseptica]MDE5433552.1 response regulator transcription factor [Elizabethkingia meningoseptica]MDE5448017.1 response regulator transcription factor [Elizabethkingia meningoseptica]
METRLTIFDEPLLYIEGISKLLANSGICSDINFCRSPETLLDQLKEAPPNILILSSTILMLTEIYKFTEIVISENKDIKIIVIGNFYNIKDIRKLFDKGIKSYLDRNSSYDEFVKSLHVLLNDEIYICDFAREKMVDFLSHQQPTAKCFNRDPLTKRELDVLRLICEGMNSKKISEKLFISINTVETHRKHILLKLNVKNSIGIVKYALENNIIN